MTDEERFRQVCEEYEKKFGAPMGHDFAMPGDTKECIKIVERCIAEGVEYDPYAPDVPRGAVF